LESVCRGNSTVGSNPTLSAVIMKTNKNEGIRNLVLSPTIRRLLKTLNAYPAGSFRLALEEAWTEAKNQYVTHAYGVANALAIGIIPSDLKGPEYHLYAVRVSEY
jgi:hypothetical protein